MWRCCFLSWWSGNICFHSKNVIWHESILLIIQNSHKRVRSWSLFAIICIKQHQIKEHTFSSAWFGYNFWWKLCSLIGMMVEGSAFTRNDVFQMALRVAFVSAVTYFSIKWLVNQIDPTSKSRKKAEERAREQLRKWVSIVDIRHVIDNFKMFFFFSI